MTQKHSSPCKKDEQAKAIIRAAGNVFRRDGYAAATLADIANEAGLARPSSLYYYFDGGKPYILFCCHCWANQLLNDCAERVHASSVPADQKLRRLIEHHVRVVTHEHVGAVPHLVAELPSNYKGVIIDQRRSYEKAVCSIIKEADPPGVQDLDIGIVTKILLGALNYIPVWFKPSGRLQEHEIQELANRLLLNNGLGLSDSGQRDGDRPSVRRVVRRRTGEGNFTPVPALP